MPFLIKNYFDVLANFDFKGRANRAEFWWFTAVQVLVYWSLQGIGNALNLSWMFPGQSILNLFVPAETIPGTIYGVLTYVQIWAQSVRRLHDRGISGWWLVPFWLSSLLSVYWEQTSVWVALLLLPLVIVFIVLWALPGNVGTNRFGDPPPLNPSRA